MANGVVLKYDPQPVEPEEPDEEPPGDGLIESVYASCVVVDAGRSEAFVDQAGVVGGGGVDDHDPVEWGAVLGGLDNPPDGVADGFFLVGH